MYTCATNNGIIIISSLLLDFIVPVIEFFDIRCRKSYAQYKHCKIKHFKNPNKAAVLSHTRRKSGDELRQAVISITTCPHSGLIMISFLAYLRRWSVLQLPWWCLSCTVEEGRRRGTIIRQHPSDPVTRLELGIRDWL